MEYEKYLSANQGLASIINVTCKRDNTLSGINKSFRFCGLMEAVHSSDLTHLMH